jgi:hypothetical protein
MGLGKNKTLLGMWVWLRDQTSKKDQPFNSFNNLKNYFLFKTSVGQFFFIQVFNNSNQLLFENFPFLKKFQVCN